jgi:hypothetical protein
MADLRPGQYYKPIGWQQRARNGRTTNDNPEIGAGSTIFIFVVFGFFFIVVFVFISNLCSGQGCGFIR